MATLLYITTEGVPGGPFELSEGTHILGSAEGSHILLRDMTISAQHGQFDVAQGQIVYTDLGSQNGSFISNEQGFVQIAQPVALVPGLYLQVGGIQLAVVEGPESTEGVETMKRETAVINTTPKAIEPGDFGSSEGVSSAFQAKKSGWIKIYIIAITIIGIVAVGALVYLAFIM